MAIVEFESEKQFQTLLSSRARELVDANVHWSLRKDLESQLEPFSAEFNQCVTFWSLTLQAHLDATIFRLIRVYDGNSSSLSLRNFLDTIAGNLEFFDVDRFRERVKGNPFVDSLIADANQPVAI